MQILYPLSHEGRPILILHNNDLKEFLVAYFPHTLYDTINYLKYMILQKIEMTLWSPKMYCIHFSHFMNVITMNTSLLQLRMTVFKTFFLCNYSFICTRKTSKEKLFCTKEQNYPGVHILTFSPRNKKIEHKFSWLVCNVKKEYWVRHLEPSSKREPVHVNHNYWLYLIKWEKGGLLPP